MFIWQYRNESIQTVTELVQKLPAGEINIPSTISLPDIGVCGMAFDQTSNLYVAKALQDEVSVAVPAIFWGKCVGVEKLNSRVYISVAICVPCLQVCLT